VSTTTGAWLGSTFRELTSLRRDARALAAALPRLGATDPSTVVLLARNSFLPLEVTMAVALTGAQVVPVSPHATAREVDFLLRDSGARIAIGDADLLEPMRDVLDGVVTIAQHTPDEVADAYGIPADTRVVQPWCLEYDEVVVRGGTGRDIAAAPASRPDASMNSLFYTSGTTGTPKGVVRGAPTKEETIRRQAVLEACYGLTPESRGLVTTPLCHMFASNFAQTTLRLGGLLVVMPRFDATEFLRTVARHGITNAQVVPTMFVRLLRLPARERARYDISTLRHVLHTGAPCPPKVKHDMIDWFGPVIWEQYGSTETGVVALCDTAEWLAHPGTVGRPFVTSEIRIFSKSGAPCPAGTPGEIYARMHGTPDFSYLGHPDARAEVEREGLISAGDIGELDADGYLYLRDRRQDLILSGGNNIYPAEVESRLAEHPDVSDCAVFGVPDEEFGQRAVAAVSLREGVCGAVADTLEAFLRTALATYKVPREYVVLPQIPRSDSGKLLRRVARDRYLQQRAVA
jgi:long-chain acyl-CoA synthetase